MPTIFPGQLGPVVRVYREGGRIVEAMRWDFASPPNLGTRPVHSTAMPIMLTADTWDVRLEGVTADALKLQRPFPPERLPTVAGGQRQHAAA